MATKLPPVNEPWNGPQLFGYIWLSGFCLVSLHTGVAAHGSSNDNMLSHHQTQNTRVTLLRLTPPTRTSCAHLPAGQFDAARPPGQRDTCFLWVQRTSPSRGTKPSPSPNR